MRTKEFEKYARNQIVINLTMLALILSCSASIVVMLKSMV